MESYIFNFTKFFQVSVFVLMMYYLVLSFFGLCKKSKQKNNLPKKSFALIVAAHNEEMVIGKIIESLKHIDYPKNLYDIYVIADNCTDNTGKIAKKCGANVYERFNSLKKGKGYALEWMFDIIFKMDKNYDAIAIFDADNLVSKNFLKEMNDKMLEGFKVVQGYIDSKNPHDSWITESYSISFWSASRMFQLARSNLKLSNQIGGTGFVVDCSILKKLGWGATCLTEDLEFTCKLVLNNERVGWAHGAVVYDEKPLTLKQSWNQRKRWMQGFSDVASRFFFKLIKKAFRDGDMVAFDCALYVIQPFVTLMLALSVLLTFIQNSTPKGLYIFTINSLVTASIWKGFSIFQFLLTPFVILIEEKLSKRLFALLTLYSLNIIVLQYVFGKNPTLSEVIFGSAAYFIIFALFIFLFMGKKSLKVFIWYLLYGVYTLTWIPITIQGIMNKNNKSWSHTKHTRQIGINEV